MKKEELVELSKICLRMKKSLKELTDYLDQNDTGNIETVKKNGNDKFQELLEKHKESEEEYQNFCNRVKTNQNLARS